MPAAGSTAASARTTNANMRMGCLLRCRRLAFYLLRCTMMARPRTKPGSWSTAAPTRNVNSHSLAFARALAVKLAETRSERAVEQAFGVSLVDLPARLRSDLEAVDHADGLPDVQRSPFGIERGVRREHHLILAEEFQSTFGRSAAPEHCGVRPEHLEVVVRPLRHRLA